MTIPTVKQRMVWVFLSLFVATLLFSLSSPALKFLIVQGDALRITHPDAISFCNILFIGNLCAGMITLLFMPKRNFFSTLRHTTLRMKGLLAASCILAVIYPTFIFIALEMTTITRIVLISRFEAIVYLLFAFFILRKRVTLAEIIGYGFISIGIIIVLLATPSMTSIKADICILLACIFYGLSEITSHHILKTLSEYQFMFIRNFFSAIIFFCIAIYLYGLPHFSALMHGDLWVVIGIYAFAIIFIGQALWFSVINKAKATWPADFALAIPFFTLIFAYLLLGEIPNVSQAVAIAIIFVGILLTKLLGRMATGKKSLGVESGLIGR